MIKKLLIANRGEISVRIIRACRDLGIKTVAIYSEADRRALPVLMADEAVLIGPPPAAESYLCIDKIVDAALQTGADAVHPGYGFLAENAEFAAACLGAGLNFVGPPARAIGSMGDKIAARQMMEDSGVPVIPGSREPITDVAEIIPLAKKAGFPILLKAVAGGGGKGMRVVHCADEIQTALEGASSEAKSAFGDGRVFWEKYLEHPRHIEIQILADKHGNIIHLNERECSIQRRHQKVIEESPSPIMTADLRRQMGEAAIAAARACGYINAGTVEFLVDTERKFYFLEMNTRLQVEHPVTELVTGLDLVKAQLLVAAGEELPYQQDQITPHGHAIEFRIYAEDPKNNFLPSPGTLSVYREPHGPGIRLDAGTYEGAEVPIYYDPLIAELAVWGETREEAINRAIRALEEYKIAGVATTIKFHCWALKHPLFRSGDISTHFVDEHFESITGCLDIDENALRPLALAAAIYEYRRAKKKTAAPPTGRRNLNWKVNGRRLSLRSISGPGGRS